MKTYAASSVFIKNLPAEHRAGNGNTQKWVLIRAKTKKRAAEILENNLYYLNRMGFHQREDLKFEGMKDETIYYEPGHTVSGYIKGLVELKGEKKVGY